MVKVNIYLSTLERLKANASDYDTRFTEGNLALFSKIVEKDSYKISQGFSYGSTPKTSTFACKISAEPYYIKAFEAYNAIKVTKVKNGTETTVFLGCKPAIKRTYETADWWSETITFNDYSKDLSDLVFHEKTDGETEDNWEWTFTATANFKVCDPADSANSLVHKIFNDYLNKDRAGLAFTLHCDFSNTDIVTSFSVKGSDKPLSIWQELLKQQGLAVYVIGLDFYILDMLADPTATAKTIDSIECNATVNEKPYIEHTIPMLRVPNKVVTFTNEELYNSGKFSVDRGKFAGTSVKPAWYPNEKDPAYAEPSFSVGDNYEVIRYYNMSYEYQTSATLGMTLLYLYKNGQKVQQTLTKQGGWYGCSGSLSEDKLKYAVANASLSQGFFSVKLTGDVDVIDYNATIKPPKNELYSGSEEKANYVYTTEEGNRYMNALLYSRDMEAKTFSFYSAQDLPLNSVCVLSHITEAGTYLRITDKQDTLDAFEGYTYSATIYSGEKVTTEATYTPASTNAPNVSHDFNFSVSRSLITCDSEGTPLDETPVTARISILKYFAIPSLFVDGTEVELVQDTATVEGEEVLLDSWHYDIPISVISATTALKATLGDFEKHITLSKVNNGSVGKDGTSVTIQYSYSPSPDRYYSKEMYWSDSEIYWGDSQAVYDFWLEKAPTEQEGRYIWLRSKVGDGEWSYTRLTGVQGTDGNGIESTTNYYLATDLATGVTTSTSGWNTDASTQKISALKPYLWNYERIEYTLTSATTTNPTIIGTYGSKGDKGEDAQYLKLESSVRSIKCLSDKRNYAIPYNQTIYIEAKTSGIEGATFEWGTSTDDYSRVTRSVAGATYIIEFTKGAWEESLTKAPYIDINCKAKVNGTVIAEESINISSIPSGGEEGVYAGSFATSTEAENYITDEFITLTSGDSYLDISLNEDGTVKNIPMTWNGGSWEETNSYSKNYANTLSSALSDALTSGNAIQENTILWLWCKNLVAENAIINNLFSKKLSIMEDGEIASDNYYAIPAVDRRFRIKADGEAEFYGIKVGNAQIDGNSDFNGTITSGPLSTTLEKGGTSGSYSISYDSSTPYWKYSELESLLDNAGFTDGYTNISGTYSELHKGYGETALSTYTTQYDVYHNPVRDQYLRINLDVGKTIATCTMSNGINPDTSALYGDEWMKANVITRTYRFNKFRKLGSGDYPNNGSIYIHLGKKGDVTIYDAFNTYYSTKYIFWKADGTCLEPKTYNQGAITINSITPTYLYRWNGNSTSSGNLNVTGTATIRNTDSSINIANKSIIALYWSSANSLTITDSDYNKHTITTNDYFYALQIDYTVKTTINSVSTVTILPKNSVSNIGSNDEKFDVGYFNTANITTINATTVNATLNGNVNSSSSSEDLKVYRAVFN